MKFIEVLPALLDGKIVRREYWSSQEYIKMSSHSFWGSIVDEEYNGYSLTMPDLTEDDWEIMEEKQ